MQKLILATHNKGKVAELAELMQPLGYEVISAGELGLPEPEETGNTFVENARLKAVAAATAAKLPALADDSGLCIPALGGKPGIHSARWGGAEKDFARACEIIRAELEAIGLSPEVEAYFICVLSLAKPDGSSMEFEGRIDGRLTFPARGAEGFGYDPIFVPAHSDKTFGEMSQQEKNSRNHRADAFRKFRDYIALKATA
jgi:XTP/dITP diphosphohydrolase